MTVRFEPNAEPIAGYKLIERIGSGGFGEVWKCLAPGGVYKAIKIIHGDLRSRDNDLVRYAEQELKSLERVKQVRHPYLLAIDRFDIVEGRLLIVMELADCNLWDRFRLHRQQGKTGVPREELLLYMEESAEVLDLMNIQYGLLHLDIKPQNIFLQYNHVKVGDFGQVKDLTGHMASVTGGITPVYAAPETFDGVVTRMCDQYSLACVYQELLTGVRPFDGMSMNQLLMQHLTVAPNLAPSPESDRPALRRALAKKPDDRFPNIREFVNALKSNQKSSVVAPGASVSPVATPTVTPNDGGSTPRIEPISYDVPSSLLLASPVLETTSNDTPIPLNLLDHEPPAEIAPPEQIGSGSLRPTLIIGVGGIGQLVLAQFRKCLNETYGSAEALPTIRLLYLDTDPEALTNAVENIEHGRSGLRAESVYSAKLYRTSHYHRPRVAGRPITEGWFDPVQLNRLQRVPTTMGLRSFGRLAFCDHYRTLVPKLRAELETMLQPESMMQTMERTGLELATNRPRVYLLAGLGGGTGSGMFLDLAYTVRKQIKHLGYADPDVVGMLFCPIDTPNEAIAPEARANVYAALTELNHYSRPTTVFQAHYDDRLKPIRDVDPPFRAVNLMPSPKSMLTTTPGTAMTGTPNHQRMFAEAQRRTASDGRRTHSDARRSAATPVPQPRMFDQLAQQDSSIQLAVDRLRHDLFTNLGQQAESHRPTDGSGVVAVRTFGMIRYGWPRCDVIERTAKVLSGVVINNWVSPDFTRAKKLIPCWVVEHMTAAGFTREQLVSRLTEAVDRMGEKPIAELVTHLIEPVVPRGWLTRSIEVPQLVRVLDQIGKAIGTPGANRTPQQLDEILRSKSSEFLKTGISKLTEALHRLIDDPHYRLAGAEESILQLIEYANTCRVECLKDAEAADLEARTWYDRLMKHIHPVPGERRPLTADLVEALRLFPMALFRATVQRRAASVYDHLKDRSLKQVQFELRNCRERIETLQMQVVRELERPCLPVAGPDLMPLGCNTIEDAAQRYLSVLTDDDLNEIEKGIQAGIESSLSGLYEACLNTTDGAESLLRVIREQARLYLNARLGSVDLASMFSNKFGSEHDATRALAQAYTDAAPQIIGAGPWGNRGVTILGTPSDEGGEPIRKLAQQAFPSREQLAFAETDDEIVVYREYSHVPLAMLPQFGPAWEAAYNSSVDMLQCTPHTRTDVLEWVSVDSP